MHDETASKRDEMYPLMDVQLFAIGNSQVVLLASDNQQTQFDLALRGSPDVSHYWSTVLELRLACVRGPPPHHSGAQPHVGTSRVTKEHYEYKTAPLPI